MGLRYGAGSRIPTAWSAVRSYTLQFDPSFWYNSIFSVESSSESVESGQIFDMIVDGDLLYAAGDFGLQIVDITDPAAPETLSWFNLGEGSIYFFRRIVKEGDVMAARPEK